MNMPWYESSLTRLETRLRTFIEGEPGMDGISRKFHKKLERELISAMQSSVTSPDGVDKSDDQKPKAPDIYILVLPTERAQQLLTHPAELDKLTQALAAAATQSGIVFARDPMLRIVAEPNATEIKVRLEYSQPGMEDSGNTEVDGGPGRSSYPGVGVVPRAFLIVNGLTTYPLTELVVNIGRDPSNQVQLEDLRVLTHARPASPDPRKLCDL